MTTRPTPLSPTRPQSGRWVGVRVGAWVAAALLALLVPTGMEVGPRPLAAQSVEQAQEQREAEYQAALADLEAAQASRRGLQSRLEQWSDSLNTARIARDDSRANNAYSELLSVTTDLGNADRRVEQTALALDRARFALKDLIDKRMDLLVEQIEFVAADETRMALALQYQDLSNRFNELDQTPPSAMQMVRVLLPNIMASPTDGARELFAKAELLERYGAKYDTLVTTIEGELADLEKRSRRDRNLRGLVAGIDRYGDANLPVGPAREVSGEEGAATVSLEDRLEELQALLTRYQALREEARDRARRLRQRAQEIAE